MDQEGDPRGSDSPEEGGDFGESFPLGIRPEDLWDLHHDLGWGTPRIAKYLSVSRGKLRRLMRLHRVPIRSRGDRKVPWYLAIPRQELTHPQDPAAFWRCRRSSRSGLGCLLCPTRDRLPEDCDENCAACPPSKAQRCPCANDAFQRSR